MCILEMAMFSQRKTETSTFRLNIAPCTFGMYLLLQKIQWFKRSPVMHVFVVCLCASMHECMYTGVDVYMQSMHV